MVLIQLFEEDGFTDEFESRIIENMVMRSSWIELIREDSEEKYYLLKKKDVEGLMSDLKEEKVRQKEKSLFKKKSTRTLKELRIIINILEILRNDQVVQGDESIALFVLQRDELLDI